MNEFYRIFPASGYALHMHKTRAVRSGYIFSTCVDMTLKLILSHPYGHLLLLHGEHASEAAALVRTLRFLYRDALNQFQKGLYLGIGFLIPLARSGKSKLTDSMTGIMNAYYMRKLSRNILDFQDIVKELHYIHNLSRRCALMLSMKKFRVVDAHECRARRRWTDDIIIIHEYLLEMFRMGDSHILKSAVRLQLAASSLLQRIVTSTSKALRSLYDATPNSG